MTSKYFLWTSILIVNILLFSSCLNSSNNSNIEYPIDPQIYTISIASKKDTTNLLPGVAFTIDQVNGKIFNRKPLPYQFHVDSVILRLGGSSNFSFSRVEITLENENPQAWNMADSIPVNKLNKIKTTAPDGVTTKTYEFKLNIYDKDPYILNWEKLETEGYPTAESERAIAHNDQFIIYYKSGNEMKAAISPSSAKMTWELRAVPSMPHTINLHSLMVSGNKIYGIDEASHSVFISNNGIDWSSVQTDYKVIALYGELPGEASGEILLAIEHNGNYKFGKTNSDFVQITPMNDIDANVPIKDFSLTKIESKTSFGTKYTLLSGGFIKDESNPNKLTPNNEICMLQENEGSIKQSKTKKPADSNLKGSTLFFYDDKPYMIATVKEGKNQLFYSDNYGLTWTKAADNQSLPNGKEVDANFITRTNASVVTDADNYIWIFGGISSSNTQLKEIWRGRLNKFTFN